jgi:hypothetical protein
VIKTDSFRLKEEAKALAKRIDLEVDSITTTTDVEEKREREERLQAMRDKLEILGVQSEINLPEVRWRVSNAMGKGCSSTFKGIKFL